MSRSTFDEFKMAWWNFQWKNSTSLRVREGYSYHPSFINHQPIIIHSSINQAYKWPLETSVWVGMIFFANLISGRMPPTLFWSKAPNKYWVQCALGSSGSKGHAEPSIFSKAEKKLWQFFQSFIWIHRKQISLHLLDGPILTLNQCSLVLTNS